LSESLEEFRESIRPEVCAVLRLAWGYWIEHRRLISVASLRLKSGDPELVDALLSEAEHLLRTRNHPASFGAWDEYGEFAEPTLLSAYCLREVWDKYEVLVCSLISEAASLHGDHPDSKQLMLTESLSSLEADSDSIFFAEKAFDLLGWHTTRHSEPIGIKIVSREDLSRIALGQEKPIDFLKRRLESNLPQNGYSYGELPLAECAGRVLMRVGERLESHLPRAKNLLAAVEAALASGNSEDWSNAVHSCRRLLQRLANYVYPPSDEVRHGKSGQLIKLGTDYYINRLACFIEDSALSGTQESMLSSSLNLVGERLEAVHNACNKGTHSTIATQAEADSYSLNALLFVGEILSLLPVEEGM
jgi:hypothetical protein